MESRLNQTNLMLGQEKAKLEQAVITNGELEGEKDGLRRKLAERDNECQDLEQRLRGSQVSVKKMQQQKEDVQMELDQVSAQVSGIGRLEGKYERELRALREQITLVTQERDTAQSSIRDAEANTFRQKSRADELEVNLEKSTKQLRLANTELDELEANLANNEDMEVIVKENKSLRKELQMKNVELQEAEDITFDAEQKAQRMEGEKLNLSTKLDETLAELGNIQVDSDGRNNRLKSQLKEKDDEISDLTRQKVTSEKLRLDLGRDLEEKEAQLTEAEESSRYLSDEMGKLKKRLIESDEELNMLLVIKTSYEELKRSSETTSRQKQGIIDEFEAQIAQLNASRRQAEEKYADLESEFEGMVQREKSAINGKTALQTKIRELQDEQDDLVNDADSAKANCRTAEARVVEISAVIDQLKQDFEQGEEDLRRSKNKVKALEDELVNISEAERRRMEVELRALKQKIAEMEDEVKRAVESLEKEKRDSKRYKRQATESENKIQDSLKKIAELEGEVNRGRAAVRRAKNEAEDYKDESERLKKQTRRLREEIDELMK